MIAGRSEIGFDIALDDLELDADGELLAALAGIPTYTHHTGADAISHRSPFQIRHAPAGTRPRTAVRPLHDCTDDRTTTP